VPSPSSAECALTSRISESVISQEFNTNPHVAVARSEAEVIPPSAAVGLGSFVDSLLGDVGLSSGPSRLAVSQSTLVDHSLENKAGDGLRQVLQKPKDRNFPHNLAGFYRMFVIYEQAPTGEN
jgi:hypothetical protein